MTTSNAEHNFVDPVCRMKVAKSSKMPSFVFESETYHFCADSCRKAFMADPEKYLKAKTIKRKGFWGRNFFGSVEQGDRGQTAVLSLEL
jgi:YHS domain-containing protein